MSARGAWLGRASGQPVEEAPAAAGGLPRPDALEERGRSIDGGIRSRIGRRAAVFARSASGCCPASDESSQPGAAAASAPAKKRS